MAHTRVQSDLSDGFASWEEPRWDDLEDSTSTSTPRGRPRAKSTDRALEAEDFELADDDTLLAADHASGPRARATYADGDTIDWLHEDAAERARLHALRSHRGLRGIARRTFAASRMWFVIVASGIGIGVVGAWLDVLVKWLGDLREGRCSYGVLYNQAACCQGLDAGEICREWQTWSQWLGVQSILGQSLLQALVYIALAVAFAASSAVLVQSYAPYAFHTGIPEIKAILGGYVFDAFLSPLTLFIKALGLALSVASGLSLGKEGPLVHVACCMAYLLSRFFPEFRQNEAQKRKLLAAAAAAGVSVAFGSPLGGVLFGLEELDTFADETETMWRGFVTSVIAAVALQYIDPFGTAKLVLFEVSANSGAWRTFELVPWMALAVIGGVLGAMLIKANVAIAIYRRNSQLNDWPVLEVIGVAAITAALSYLVVFLRVQSSELVANLFLECDPARGDYHGLCNPTALWRNVFLLLLTAGFKIAFTSWTFGMMVPAGIFLPSIAIGASLGRAVGLITQGFHRLYPTAWIFSTCPPDPTIPCVSPGFYAVIGAAAMLGGVTRMTISLVVIMFELTGALSHVLPIMISVMMSKWVGDAFGKEGIYASWIAMRRYPWLSNEEYRDTGETAATLMRRADELVVIRDRRCTLGELDELSSHHGFRGFPVVCDRNEVLGFVVRIKLREWLDDLLASDPTSRSSYCAFVSRPSTEGEEAECVDASSLLEVDVLQLRKEMPLELVVTTFQKMNLQHIVFTQAGVLTGMVTKSDVVALLTARFPETGALETAPGWRGTMFE